MRKALLIGVSTAVVGLGAMAFADQSALKPRPDTFRMLELFGDVLAVVESQYVVPVDDKKLIEAALNGMLTSLDPHSAYLSPEQFKDLRDSSRGAYGGIGLEVTSEDGAVKVITPMDETPAAKAGVQAGDYITAIDGQSILGLSLTDAVKQLKGAPGSTVKITLVREKEEPKEVSLVREIINVKSVRPRVENGYGVLRISNFNENTGRETREAIASLQNQLPGMRGLVLDLRNNPGGILEQSVEVADVFLDGGEVVSQRGRNPRDIERYNAQRGDLLKGVPVVVLVNPGSASAAEIVAGALQDRKRATVLGLTSFGKGSVQTVMPLRGGMDGALKLTTARYYTPSGRSIQQTGIEPDLEVAQSKEQAEIIANSRFQFSEAAFRNALNADEGKARRGAHEVTEVPPADFDTKKGDYQLTRAFDVLAAGGDLRAIKPRGQALQQAELVKRPAAVASAGQKVGVAADPIPTPPSKTAPPEVPAPKK